MTTVINSNEVCAFCGKSTKNTALHITPHDPICTDCWNRLFGPLSKLIRDKVRKLFGVKLSNFSNLQQAIQESNDENNRLRAKTTSINDRINLLEERAKTIKIDLESNNEKHRHAFAKLLNSDIRISTLYHITPMENIPSIITSGLLCHNLVKGNELPILSCSNHAIQESRSHIMIGGQSANDYVPLFFSEKPPMLWPIERDYPEIVMVYICIRGEIIGEKGVCFSDGNIAAKETTKYHDLADLTILDWPRIRLFNEVNCSREEAKRIKSAEVLVPSKIDTSWFDKLVVPNPEAKLKLQTLLPKPISIEIRPEFYHNPRSRRY